MRTVLSAWFAACLVAAIALLSMAGLAPEETGPVDEYAQVLRVHLPWLAFSVVMAFVAAVYVGDGSSGKRLLTALPVPIAATALCTSLGIPGSDTALGAGLHVIEALLGVALGLSVAAWLTGGFDDGRRSRAAGQIWRDSGP